MKRAFVLTLAFIALAALFLLLRSAVEAKRAYDRGRSALEARDFESAILHFRHAVEWNAPFVASSDDAFAALLRVGDERAAAGDVSTALFAYRSARVGALATRHFVVPHAASLPELERRIGLLMADQSTASPADRRDKAARHAAEFARADADLAPRATGFFAGIGFALWIASLAAIALVGFDADGRVRRRRLSWLALLSLILLAAWIGLVRLS